MAMCIIPAPLTHLAGPPRGAYEPDCLYLVSNVQGDFSQGNLMFVDEEAINRDDDGTVFGISGRVYHETYELYDYFGVMVDDVITNYTHYLRKRNAAALIQKRWRAVRRERAARVVQHAWRRWQVKMNEVWNPHCFVGLVNLTIEAIRACA